MPGPIKRLAATVDKTVAKELKYEEKIPKKGEYYPYRLLEDPESILDFLKYSTRGALATSKANAIIIDLLESEDILTEEEKEFLVFNMDKLGTVEILEFLEPKIYKAITKNKG